MIRPAETLFRIQIQESRHIHEREQKIAHLLADMSGVPLLVSLAQFVEFLLGFVENFFDTLPVKAAARRAVL